MAGVWDQSQLVRAPTAYRLQLGKRRALFCGRKQHLYELNPTADAIWLALGSHTPAQVAEILSGGGSDLDQMLGYVRDAARAWMGHGLLAPPQIEALRAGAPTGEIHLSIDELNARIRTFGDLSIEPVEAVFGQFSGPGGEANLDITTAKMGDLIFLHENGELLGAFDDQAWIPQLKALLTDRYAHAVKDAFLAHAALLAWGGKGLLICGLPGAGKSTLTTALLAAGFEYHADDITRIDGKGRARGVPFSPALKTGSWPLVSGLAPEVADLPVYLRGDGQAVRYMPVPAPATASLEIAAVVLLAREANAPARIDAVEPLDTLSAILGSAFSARGGIEPQTLEALVATVNAAGNGRLIYSDLDGAVDVLKALLE